MDKNQIVIKNMISNEQKTVDYDDLIEEIYRIFDELEDLNEFNV